MSRFLLILTLACLAIAAPARSAIAAGELPVVVLLGDSLTRRGDWSALSNQVQIVNQGIDGDGLDDIDYRLDGVLGLHPDAIFLQAGINDLIRGVNVEYFALQHERLWKRIMAADPPIRLVVCSLLTVHPQQIASVIRLNRRVVFANVLMADKAKELGVEFIDLNAAMFGPGGHPEKDFTTDGLHLADKAYELWIKALRPLMPAAALP